MRRRKHHSAQPRRVLPRRSPNHKLANTRLRRRGDGHQQYPCQTKFHPRSCAYLPDTLATGLARTSDQFTPTGANPGCPAPHNMQRWDHHRGIAKTGGFKLSLLAPCSERCLIERWESGPSDEAPALKAHEAICDRTLQNFWSSTVIIIHEHAHIVLRPADSEIQERE